MSERSRRVMRKPRAVAEPGQYTCRRDDPDPKTGERKDCGKEVPPGPLTCLALNERGGHFLALCTEHRWQLNRDYRDWLHAEVDVSSRLTGDLIELTNGALVPHAVLHDVLVEKGIRKKNAKGPIEKLQKLYAIGEIYGAEEREALAAQWEAEERTTRERRAYWKKRSGGS